MCLSRGTNKKAGSFIFEPHNCFNTKQQQQQQQQVSSSSSPSLKTTGTSVIDNEGLFCLKGSVDILQKHRKLSVGSSDITQETIPETTSLSSSSSCCSNPTAATSAACCAEIENIVACNFAKQDLHVESSGSTSSLLTEEDVLQAEHSNDITTEDKLLDKRNELKSLRTALQKRLASFSSSRIEAATNKEQKGDLEESDMIEFLPPPKNLVVLLARLILAKCDASS